MREEAEQCLAHLDAALPLTTGRDKRKGELRDAYLLTRKELGDATRPFCPGELLC